MCICADMPVCHRHNRREPSKPTHYAWTPPPVKVTLLPRKAYARQRHTPSPGGQKCVSRTRAACGQLAVEAEEGETYTLVHGASQEEEHDTLVRRERQQKKTENVRLSCAPPPHKGPTLMGNAKGRGGRHAAPQVTPSCPHEAPSCMDVGATGPLPQSSRHVGNPWLGRSAADLRLRVRPRTLVSFLPRL